LISSRSPSIIKSGTVLLWAATIFFCSFLIFTISAVAFAWPPGWATLLGLHSNEPSDRGPEARKSEVKSREGPPLQTTGNCSPVIVTNNGQSKTEIRCDK
jgi:hypothetical protein